jgi:hypothetical protein
MKSRSMKYQTTGIHSVLWLLLGFAVALSARAQIAPPNDIYANRAELTGTDITFTGNLAGATLDDIPPYGLNNELNTYETYGMNAYRLPVSQSVWWKWTAPGETVLTIQIIGEPSPDSPVALPNFFAIYTASNGATDVNGLKLPALAFMSMYAGQSPQTISLPVNTGTEYELQLIGSNSISDTFHLIATNTPIIIQQPISQTVYSNASAMFYVVSAGVNPSAFTFQWRLGGANLPGETAPMLALTNIDASMAGDYSVVVSNTNGIATSQSATLTVSQSNVPVVLSLIGVGSNSFQFSLTGENGRNYRIESSTDLVNWAPEGSFRFLSNSPATLSTSVIFNQNSPTALMVPMNSTAKFYRARPYVPVNAHAEICVNNLRQIRVAKLLWARDYYLSPYSTPDTGNLQPYFPRQQLPVCPDDPYDLFETSYYLQSLPALPACIINPLDHLLEEAP